MELLLHPEDRGYPTEYLLSRIRGRRAGLIRDWKALLFDAAPLDMLLSSRSRGGVGEASPDAVWRRLMKEYRWVYGQMNRRHRNIFSYYFLYAELRTITICLRQMKDRKSTRMEEFFEESLLSNELRKACLSSMDSSAAIDEVSRVFSRLSPVFAGLPRWFAEEGQRGAERRLADRFLEHAVQQKLHPLIKAFMVRMIDARNLLRLAVSVQQETMNAPDFIAFGSLPMEQLARIQLQRDLMAVDLLVRKYAGVKVELQDPSRAEHALYQATTAYLKRAGRDPLGVGTVLDYLWRCSMEAMNLSILFYGKSVERDALTNELVS
jgi:vacuolar-type H+-ATPase subunit C/Vma6